MSAEQKKQVEDALGLEIQGDHVFDDRGRYPIPPLSSLEDFPDARPEDNECPYEGLDGPCQRRRYVLTDGRLACTHGHVERDSRSPIRSLEQQNALLNDLDAFRDLARRAEEALVEVRRYGEAHGLAFDVLDLIDEIESNIVARADSMSGRLFGLRLPTRGNATQAPGGLWLEARELKDSVRQEPLRMYGAPHLAKKFIGVASARRFRQANPDLANLSVEELPQ